MSTARKQPTGIVTLVATGPGAADLLPVRAARALREAEFVFADADALATAKQLAHKHAEIVPALDADGTPLDRAARAKAVTTAAKAGRRVVRVFAGDPVLDGAFAKESAALVKAGVTFEFVPGVSTVTGAAAYAGVGLTSKAVSEVRIVDFSVAAPNWSEQIGAHVTLVLLNAADQVAEIANALLTAGRDPQTPVLINRDGATVGQRSLSAALDSIASAAKSAGHSGNGVVIVGSTAARAGDLSWFEARPLFGWNVLLPRTKNHEDGLTVALERLGAVVTEVPTLSVEPPRTPQQMDKAIKGLVGGRFEWVLFTCVNSVDAVWAKCDEYGLDARVFAGLKIAASGTGTIARLADFGIRPDVSVEDGGSTHDLLELFPQYDALTDPFNRVFLPRADIATESLSAGLVELGWEVEDVTAFRTVRAMPPSTEIREAIKAGGFDAVVFTSAATVRNLVGIAGKPHANTLVACIGPNTAAACEEHGLVPAVVSTSPDVAMLVHEIAVAGAELRDAALAAGEFNWRPSLKRSRRKAH